MKTITTWILIADGTQARIACNDGPGRGIKPVIDETFHGSNLPGREIMSDRPGRTFDSAGKGRHAKVPPSDPREVEKRRFAREMAALLDEGVKQDRYDRLVIIAPPKALGHLRAELSEGVRAKVSGEINRDLIHVPLHDLARHLGTLLAA
jgi:protein required for attachment to host cells